MVAIVPAPLQTIVSVDVDLEQLQVDSHVASSSGGDSPAISTSISKSTVAL
jgi:hypothetical protein